MGWSSARRPPTPRRRRRTAGFASASLLMFLPAGCATVAPAALGPADVPALRAQVARRPGDAGAHLRLAAALASAERCPEAVGVASRGRELDPTDPLGPLVMGECLERAGDLEEALRLYADFLDRHGAVRGAAAVAGRRTLALRQWAAESARQALDREAAVGSVAQDAVGVLPFVVDGPERFRPLSLGMAQMLTTDLALLGRFPLVERLRLDALLAEQRLSAREVDPATAARTGRLSGASRIVVGTLAIPEGDALRLGGTIIDDAGDLRESVETDGTLEDLLALEKDYALRIAEGLGYVLGEAERQRVLERRPGSLAAFLAFSRGLLAESEGDFGAAALHHGEAVRLDPAYDEALAGLRRAVGADVVSGGGPGQASVSVHRVEQVLASTPGPDPSSGALNGSVLDLASHQSERTTLDVGLADTNVDTLPVSPDALPALRALLTLVITIPR